MYGLLLRAIQSYLRETYGLALWGRVLRTANLPPEGFEPMMPYSLTVLRRVLGAVALELQRPLAPVLEDVGTFLIAAPPNQPLRRLLRFGGATFADFLHSLEELPDRARLALPGLDLPPLVLVEPAPGQFRLEIQGNFQVALPLALGALRAMADDYGALVLIEAVFPRGGARVMELRLQLLDAAHSRGQEFELIPQERADGY